MSSRSYRAGLFEVADGVHAYLQPDGSWGWSNAGLVVGDGGEALLVDTLFDLRLTERMLTTMRRVLPTGADIGTVVNTHANGDHCWGNQLVRSARILATRRCAEEMSGLPPAVLAGLLDAAPTLGPVGAFLQHAFGAFDFSGIELTLPTQTFDGTLALEVGGVEVRLVEVGPAHTRGDLVVHLPAHEVVFTGDILFSGGHPVMWEGPVDNWIAALDRVADMAPATVVPGHGPVGDLGAVRSLRDYFVDLRSAVHERHAAGMSLTDAQRDVHAALTSGRYAEWGESERVAVNVATVYRELDGVREPAPVAELFAAMAALAAG